MQKLPEPESSVPESPVQESLVPESLVLELPVGQEPEQQPPEAAALQSGQAPEWHHRSRCRAEGPLENA